MDLAGCVLRIWPVVAAPIDAFGLQKLAWLNALNISYRNLNLFPPVMLKL
jgi:hypothetical protein